MSLEGGGNQRAAMGGQAVCMCERVFKLWCGQHPCDGHIAVPSKCVRLCTAVCINCIFNVGEWIFRRFFISPTYLLGASMGRSRGL